MNSTSSRTAEAQQTRHGVYFFLSYAHSAPTSERVRSDLDPVGIFFKDLTEAVKGRARPAAGMEIGFFDQQIPPGADMKALLSEALGSAEVFVPLYSPGYLAKSWPRREQEVFRRRLRAASAVAPEEHIVPILWTPIPLWEQTPSVAKALSIGASISDYGENGLRALCMLESYRHSYQLVLSRLADEIVTVAERSPLGPSMAPDLDDVPRPEPTAEAGFLVVMLSPRHGGSRPPHAVKGGEDPWWRTYTGRRIPPVAEHAGSVAERLGLDTQVAEFAEVEELFNQTPAIVIVDPWVVVDRGSEFLRSIFAGLPEWIVPLILAGQRGAPGSDSALADKAVEVLNSVLQVPANRVNSMDQLDEILPTAVARARRTYLRNGPVYPPPGPSVRPGRLRDEYLRSAEVSETDE